MFKIEGVIDRNRLIEKLATNDYCDYQFGDLENVLDKMIEYQDKIVIGYEEAARLYEVVRCNNSVANAAFLEYVNRSKIKVEDIDFTQILQSIEEFTSPLNTSLIILGEEKSLKNCVFDLNSLYQLSRLLLEEESQYHFFDTLKRCFNNCIFSEEARSSISRVNRSVFTSDLKEYISHLSNLNDHAIDIWLSEECSSNEYFCKVFQAKTGIVNSTENDRTTANRRIFNFQWKEINEKKEEINISEQIKCEKHTKIELYGGNAQRIHFEIREIKNEIKVCIGYIGNHLK